MTIFVYYRRVRVVWEQSDWCGADGAVTAEEFRLTLAAWEQSNRAVHVS